MRIGQLDKKKLTFEKLEAIANRFLDSLPEQIKNRSRQIAKQKKQQKRMIPFFKTVAELGNTYQLLPAKPHNRRVNAYLQLVNHVEQLWEDSTRLFLACRYSSSVFFSIVTIEELGKLAIAKVQAVVGIPKTCSAKGTGGGKSPLRSHVRKHMMAACAGAVINS
jgi:hypothetical protein